MTPMLSLFVSKYLFVLAALLPIINPPGLVPFFISLTSHNSNAQRAFLARRIAICAAEDGERLLAVMRAHPRGRNAALIGRIVEDKARLVTMRTSFGGSRVVDWIAGEQLPRIC